MIRGVYNVEMPYKQNLYTILCMISSTTNIQLHAAYPTLLITSNLDRVNSNSLDAKSVAQFIDVMNWRIHGGITGEEFSVLYVTMKIKFPFPNISIIQ